MLTAPCCGSLMQIFHKAARYAANLGQTLQHKVNQTTAVLPALQQQAYSTVHQPGCPILGCMSAADRFCMWVAVRNLHPPGVCGTLLYCGYHLLLLQASADVAVCLLPLDALLMPHCALCDRTVASRHLCCCLRSVPSLQGINGCVPHIVQKECCADCAGCAGREARPQR